MSINRKQFLKVSTAVAGMLSIHPACMLFSKKNELEKIIRKIGSAGSEKDRDELLERIVQQNNFSEEENRIFEQLFSVSDRWINGQEKYANPGSDGNESEGYLCGFLYRCKIDRYYFPRLEEASVFFPLIAFYRSRMLLAHLIQNGAISMVPENRKQYINESVRLLSIAHKAFPENELINAYLGNYLPWNELAEFNKNAPDWANYQRMALEKLTYLIHWWIDNRQISDGQFGGGWGDDVEMWRNWIPVLFAFED